MERPMQMARRPKMPPAAMAAMTLVERPPSLVIVIDRWTFSSGIGPDVIGQRQLEHEGTRGNVVQM